MHHPRNVGFLLSAASTRASGINSFVMKQSPKFHFRLQLTTSAWDWQDYCAFKAGTLGFSVCRKLWNPWHRICRAPPPKILLNPDIFNTSELSKPTFALETSIKQINMKLFKVLQLLTYALSSYARRYYVSCFYTGSLKPSPRRSTVTVTLFILCKRTSSCITLSLDRSFIREKLFKRSVRPLRTSL